MDTNGHKFIRQSASILVSTSIAQQQFEGLVFERQFSRHSCPSCEFVVSFAILRRRFDLTPLSDQRK